MKTLKESIIGSMGMGDEWIKRNQYPILVIKNFVDALINNVTAPHGKFTVEREDNFSTYFNKAPGFTGLQKVNAYRFRISNNGDFGKKVSDIIDEMKKIDPDIFERFCAVNNELIQDKTGDPKYQIYFDLIGNTKVNILIEIKFYKTYHKEINNIIHKL